MRTDGRRRLLIHILRSSKQHFLMLAEGIKYIAHCSEILELILHSYFAGRTALHFLI